MAYQDVESFNKSSVLDAFPSSLKRVFEDRPLLIGESAAEYDLLIAGIINDFQPSSTIEFLWCKEVADYIWDLQRVRRMRRILIEEEYCDSLLDLADLELVRKEGQSLNDVVEMVVSFVDGARENNQPDVKGLASILARVGLTHERVYAQAYSRLVDELAFLDREIVRYERRRDELLHQIVGWNALRRARAREALDRAAKTIEAVPIDAAGLNAPPDIPAPETARQAGSDAGVGVVIPPVEKKSRVAARAVKAAGRERTA